MQRGGNVQIYTDEFGLGFTAGTADSAAAFGRLTRCYMGFRRDTGTVLADLLAADPDMPMARCAQGYFAKLFGSASFAARAAAVSKDLDTHLERVSATDRERRHAAALRAWVNGRIDAATALWEEILLEDPLDGLALRLAHFTHFYSGDGRRIRDSIARTLPRWPDSHPDYGFVLGMYAFGLEESGEYEKAEHFGRRAVERNPEDAWSVHSVAHVMEMTGRHRDGVEWVRGLAPHWSVVNNFRFHLHWHESLYHLELGDFEEVFRIYDEEVVSDIESEFYLDICNASSLLRRLEMYGLDVGDRWQQLAEVSRRHVGDTELIFVTLHYLMALVSAGADDDADAMIATIERWAAGDGTQSKICRTSGLSLARAMRHLRRGETADGIREIDTVRYVMDGVGGSMAQRDVFQMMLIDAVRNSGNSHGQRALFAERVEQKPGSSWAWEGYADALEALGDPTAVAARAKADALLAAA